MSVPQSPQVIVLNGGSSSGTSGISRCLQAILPGPWLRLGVDDLVDRLPPSLFESGDGVTSGAHGSVATGPGFRELEAAWLAGVAAMANAGGRIVYDDVFLSGAASQQRLRAHLDGVSVLWVGIRCDAATAAGRELARGDRPPGMATAQAELVHNGVLCDLEVDTTNTQSLDCARVIAAQVGGHEQRHHR
jgi:chloramphenicol 3-O phosphotransferase